MTPVAEKNGTSACIGHVLRFANPDHRDRKHKLTSPNSASWKSSLTGFRVALVRCAQARVISQGQEYPSPGTSRHKSHLAPPSPQLIVSVDAIRYSEILLPTRTPSSYYGYR